MNDSFFLICNAGCYKKIDLKLLLRIKFQAMKKRIIILTVVFTYLLCVNSAFAQCGADGEQPCNPTPNKKVVKAKKSSEKPIHIIYDSAITDWTKSIKLRLLFADTYYCRAETYDKDGREKLAEADRGMYEKLKNR